MFSSFLISRSLFKNAGLYCKQTLPRTVNRSFTSTVARQNCLRNPQNVVRSSVPVLTKFSFSSLSEKFSSGAQTIIASIRHHKILRECSRACKQRNQSCGMVARRLFRNGVCSSDIRWDSHLCTPVGKRYDRDIQNYSANYPMNYPINNK